MKSPDDYEYEFIERFAKRTECGESDLQATQEARRQVRNDLKENGLGINEANKQVMEIERNAFERIVRLD